MKDFEVFPAFFRGNKKYGRTTKVRNVLSGEEQEFLGVLGKKAAIKNFKAKKRRR